MHRVTVVHRPPRPPRAVDPERQRLADVWRATHALARADTHALVVYATAHHVDPLVALDELREPP